ncbi:MAG: SGNH/GDSL hydrolase family protein [Candidatus Thorarchaeota archaeon]|jgi:lysophospholipase L1-like esterase
MASDKTKTVNILGFGDSLTAGTPGYDAEHGWGDERSQYGFWIVESARVEDIVVRFDNKGVPGELAEWMLPRLDSLLKVNEYDIIIILGGSNDIGWGKGVDPVYGDLVGLWKRAKESSKHVVGCTIPPIASRFPLIQEKQVKLNSMILRYGEDNTHLVAVDVFTQLADKDGLLQRPYDSGDGLHLSAEGYRKMGEEIWKSGISGIV